MRPRAGGVAFALLAALACQQRKQPLATAITPATHTKFPITSGVHALGCNTCHGDFDTFQQFTCLNCHAGTSSAHDQSTTDELHRSLVAGGGALSDGGIGYAYSSASCLGCHASGSRVVFDHAGVTSSCATCHDTGSPFEALPVAGRGRDGGSFVHPDKRGNDCHACHTIANWIDAKGVPDDVRDPAQDRVVTGQVPSWAGTSITSVTAQTETLPMPMVHSSATVPSSAACVSCHANANAGVFFPGRMHASFVALNLAQPAACLDCHAKSVPKGFVGPTATNPSRTPPSPEMKHDAVLWRNGVPTTTPAVPQECSLCHLPPPTSFNWSTTQKFHSSLTAPSQPSSCLDCHANSRPVALLTSANSALPASVQFDHSAGAAMGECTTCHLGGSTQFTSWSGGQFHLAGSTTPSTCLPCHTGERPTSTSGWRSNSYQNSPFDYLTNATGVTHGAGQDCVTCHAGPGTGTWGGTGSPQNWVGGSFAHGASSTAGTTCLACHTTQRPDLVLGQTTAANLLPGNFDHAVRGTGDCFGCHQATVAANTYVKYFNSSGTLPGGDWNGGGSYPGSTLISAPGQFITVTETTLIRSGLHNLVTSTSTVSATLFDAMLHVSTVLPPELNAGPTDNPDPSKCWHCHTNTNGTVTSFANGQYHSSLDTFQTTPGAPITPLPQPISQCTDCHSQMRPTAIVEKSVSELQPMDHDAVFATGLFSSANQMECATCHRHPGKTWADGTFHASIGSAVPQDCTTCHYPVMADGAKADLTSGVSYTMSHQSAQLTFQNCQSCHGTALSNGTATPLASTLWKPGAFHSSVAPQPVACNDCHAPVSKPTATTQSSFSYTLAAGATSSNQRQWMNHASASVVGKDCTICHGGDAAPGVTAWSKSDSFHAAVANAVTCGECHGLTNGGGSVPGTNNNLSAGLTDSSTVTSAASDPSTGIPAGTLDQITHSDVNATLHDCRFCHSQAGASTASGIQGHEWAQASFHTSFNAANPLVINGTTGRCSNCHMNVKPGAGFTAQDHSSFTSASGTQDCSACHSWPGTSVASSPNWLGASGVPQFIPVGGFTVPAPPAASPMVQGGIADLPHPTVAAGVGCTSCHTSSGGGRPATGYDHASALIKANCNACHEAGSDLVGTPWNGVPSESLGAGDTRPFTLTSVYAAYSGGSLTVTWPNHFYNSGTMIVDCKECHVVPAGYGSTTTGTAYLKIGSNGQSSTGAWAFPHTQAEMTYPDTCRMCHGNNIPN